VLAAYGSVVNVPRWTSAKLVGVYVVLFFLIGADFSTKFASASPHPADLRWWSADYGWRGGDGFWKG